MRPRRSSGLDSLLPHSKMFLEVHSLNRISLLAQKSLCSLNRVYNHNRMRSRLLSLTAGIFVVPCPPPFLFVFGNVMWMLWKETTLARIVNTFRERIIHQCIYHQYCTDIIFRVHKPVGAKINFYSCGKFFFLSACTQKELTWVPVFLEYGIHGPHIRGSPFSHDKT